jgi:hypothetical protein
VSSLENTAAIRYFDFFIKKLGKLINVLKEEDLAMIAAQQILVQFGPNENLQQDKLFSLLPGYIPDYCLTASDKALSRWATLVSQAYKKVRAKLFSIK